MKVRCPVCREWCRWEGNPFRPFCGEECRRHDLGNWATERYRIPVEEEAEKDGAPVDKKAGSGEEEE